VLGGTKILTAPAVAAAAFFAIGGAASAAPTQISGSFPNGGCSSTHRVTVTSPTRIETSVSTTSASELYTVSVVDAAGRTVSDTGAYDTPGAGTYGVRVCSQGDALDPATMQYTGLLGTGPAGRPALLSGGAAALMFK
jgi:hypothetical protein